jgi:hypothetical protein
MQSQKIGYRVALCKKSQTWAKKNWRGSNGTIKIAERFTEFYLSALACLSWPQTIWTATGES